MEITELNWFFCDEGYFVVFSSFSRQVLVYYLKIEHVPYL